MSPARDFFRTLGIALLTLGLSTISVVLLSRRAIVHFYGDPWAINLTPPATVAELANYRIVTNQFKLMAVQKRDGTNWTLLPNRWKDADGCRWDIDWWIARDRPNTQEEHAVWIPLRGP